MNFLNNVNLNLNELQNAKFQILATDPVSLTEALFWYNSTAKAVKFYDGTTTHILATLANLTSMFEYKGVIDCSTNPNYPAGSIGDAYFISVAGKIGGASGEAVEAGDMIVCNEDNAGGTEASVGTKWDAIQRNLPSNIAKTYTQTGVTLGSGAGTVTITHNLNTKLVSITVMDSTTGETYYVDEARPTVNTITLTANGSAVSVDVLVVAKD